MFAWGLTIDQAMLFYEICEELNATTEEQRVQILIEMARMGKVKNLTKTHMSKENYLKHLSKNFSVAELNEDGSISKYRDDPKENDSHG